MNCMPCGIEWNGMEPNRLDWIDWIFHGRECESEHMSAGKRTCTNIHSYIHIGMLSSA